MQGNLLVILKTDLPPIDNILYSLLFFIVNRHSTTQVPSPEQIMPGRK